MADDKTKDALSAAVSVGSVNNSLVVGGTGHNIQIGRPGPDAAALRRAYLNRVVAELAPISLVGIDPKAASGDPDTRLQLSAIYTALLTQTQEERRPKSQQEEPGEARMLSALAMLDREAHLVLLGEPGGGKTTFARFVALCLAGEGLGHAHLNCRLLAAPLPEEDGEDGEEPQAWRHGALLPLLLNLRDFAARGLPRPGERATAGHLWDFLAGELKDALLGEWIDPLGEELRRDGGLLLLDGLDEVPEAERRRKQIVEAVTDLARSFPKLRVVVTSRTYAYQKQEFRLPGFTAAVLAPFTSGQVVRFIQRFYGQLVQIRGMREEEAQGRAELLRRAIFGSDRLVALAERPLLLTLMASLHAWRGGSLPEKREELYHDAVGLLLDLWDQDKVVRDASGVRVAQPSLSHWLKVDRDQMRDFLNELAEGVHGAQPELHGTADIDEGELVKGLMRLNPDEEVDLRRLVEYLRDRAGLLLARGVGVYSFPHRTFQEYLAACHLTDCDYPDRLAELARREPERWREVVLLAGAKAARGSASTIWSLVDALCWREPGEGDRGDAWGAHLAGQLLCEVGPRVNERHRGKVERVRRWLVWLLGADALPARERAKAGVHLAMMGDPRPEITVSGMQFCRVPAGPFRMGSEVAEGERPVHEVEIPYDYEISRYPVTQGQYQEFVEAGGYQEDRYWKEVDEAGWRPAEQDRHDSPFDLPNHPVMGVSWYEALAFCRWLGEKMRMQVMVPSEAEWEKAAGGSRFPWGEEEDAERANLKESQIGTTSAVGCFPRGKSPYGCEEMMGNVWEWTRSVYRPYPYQAGDGREDSAALLKERRVFRGYGFHFSQKNARCTIRYSMRSDPYVYISPAGFRVVRRPFFSGL